MTQRTVETLGAVPNVPQPTNRRVRKRMVPERRVLGLHGASKDNPEAKRKSREQLYGCVMEAFANNKYLIRFDNNIENE